jgi:hypothetical protein
VKAPGHHHVARQVLAVKEARVAFEAAVGVDAFEVEREVFYFMWRACMCGRGAR